MSTNTTLGRAIMRTEMDLVGLKQGLDQAKRQTQTTFNQMERESRDTGRRVGRNLRDGFEALGDLNLGAILGAGGALFAMKSLADESYRVRTAGRLMERQFERNNLVFDDARAEIQAVANELKIMPELVADNVAQLLRQGLTMQEITASFKAGAASSLAFGKSAQFGVDRVTEALITQRSTLLDTIGISQNFDIAYKEYAKTLGKTADALTTTERAQAAVALITRYTKEEVEDLPFMMEGVAGATSEMTRELAELRVELGEKLEPAVTATVRGLTSALEIAQGLPGPVKDFGVGAAVAATGVTTLGIAVGALRIALVGLGGPAGIILAVAAALGGALFAAINKSKNDFTKLKGEVDKANESLEEAGSQEELLSTMQTLSETLEGDAKDAWDTYTESVKGSKEELVKLREEAAETYAQLAAGTLLAQRAVIAARLQAQKQARSEVEALAGDGPTAEQRRARLPDLQQQRNEVFNQLQALTLGPGSPERQAEAVALASRLGELDAEIAAIKAATGNTEQLAKSLTAMDEEIEGTTAELAALDERLAELGITVDDGKDEPSPTGGDNPPPPSDEPPEGSLAYLNKQLKEAQEQFANAVTQAERDAADARIQALEAEIAEIEQRYNEVEIPKPEATGGINERGQRLARNEALSNENFNDWMGSIATRQRPTSQADIQAAGEANLDRLLESAGDALAWVGSRIKEPLLDLLAQVERENARAERVAEMRITPSQATIDAQLQLQASRDPAAINQAIARRHAGNLLEGAQGLLGRVGDRVAEMNLGERMRDAAAVTEEMMKLSETLELAEMKAAAFGDEFDLVGAQMNATQTAIVNLLEQGIDPESQAVQDLVRQWQEYQAQQEANEQAAEDEKEAKEEAEEALRAYNDAVAEANELLGNAPSAMDATIQALEDLRDKLAEDEEKLRVVNALLEELYAAREQGNFVTKIQEIETTIAAVGSAVTKLFETDWSNGNSILENTTSAIGDIMSLIPGVGGAIGSLISTIGNVLSGVLGDMSNGMKQVREEMEETSNRFKLIDAGELLQTKQVSRGGLLGLLGFTKAVVDEEASALGLSVAQAIESGVLGGLKNGIDKFNETGKIEDLEFGIQQGIFDGAMNALFEAIIQQGIIQELLGPQLLELSKAIAEGYKTGNYSRAQDIIGNLQQTVPQIAAELAPILAEFNKLRPEDPDAANDPSRKTDGAQITEITGPSRDFLFDLLTPLAHLVSVPNLLKEILLVNQDMRDILRGGEISIANRTVINTSEPVQQAGAFNRLLERRDDASSRDIIVQGDLNVITQSKNARELYRDISNFQGILVRGRG